MDPIRLSIIIPVFNSAKTLADTLKSIVRQQFQGLECWIIDGNSTDGSMEIARSYAAKNDYIKCISEPDRGIYDAMNKGIGLAGGNYLYFMGSDDKFYSETVLNDLFSLPCFSRADLIYGDIVFKHSGIRQGGEKNYLKLIKNLENINHQSIFYARKVFSVIGNYDLRFPIYADFNFNIRCFRDNNLSKEYISYPVCIFNEKGASFFHRNRDNYIQELHEQYVAGHEDPVALYDSVMQLEAELVKLQYSKDYLLGKRIGNTVRRLRKFFRPGKPTIPLPMGKTATNR